MANPRGPIDGLYLYTQSGRINEVMIALYGASPENLFEGDLELDNLPTIEEIELICNDFLGTTDEDGVFTLYEEIPIKEIRGLIVNLVLYDALLDDTLYGQDLPDTYQPRRLLELIHYDGLDDVVIYFGYNYGDNERRHIFHWASERLFPYFLDRLGEEFIRSEFDDAVGPNGNTYLHSYLEGSSFRVLNPTFVTYLLGIGFSLSTPNNDGDTPLHLIVYESRHYVDPFPTLSKEGRKALRMSLVREGNELALRQYDNRMKRYNRYYQTLILLFRHGIHMDEEGNIDHPDFRIENDQGVTVGEIIYGADHDYPLEDLREAHEVAMGRPSAMERAKQQKLANALHLLPKTNTDRIRQMLGTNLERAQAVVEKKHAKQINNTTQRKRSMQNELLLRNTRRKKQNMHRELLNRIPRNNQSGGDTSHAAQTHPPLHRRRTRRAKKRAHKKRHTRR